MIIYPITFRAQSSSIAGIDATWSGAAAGGTLTVAIPHQFLGPGGGFSPEDLYCLAAANCFVATFKVIAENSRLEYTGVRCDVEMTIDQNALKKPQIEKLQFQVVLSGVKDKAKAQRLLDKTSSSCIVLNSLQPPKQFEYTFGDL